MSGVIMYDVIQKLLLFLVRNSYWLKKQTISKAKWKIFFHSFSSSVGQEAQTSWSSAHPDLCVKLSAVVKFTVK